VNASYRLGIAIVVGTVLGSLAVCLATVSPAPAPVRAGQDLGDRGFPLGLFRLVERSGRAVTDADLAGRVWVAAFVFTRCPLSCPKITSVMKGLQGKFEGTGVKLVSVSVDPEHDTPEVLAEYARRFGADPDRWWFLTGPKAEVVGLIHDRFLLPVEAASDDDRRAGAEAFSHSARLALVGRGNTVLGYFDSGDRAEVEALVARARRLDRAPPGWVRRLPAVNAGLNASCAALLGLGWVMIRTGRWRAHAAAMTAAVAVSSLFLGCYLVYHWFAGSVPFRGVGPVRLVYFTTLLSHTLLATFGVVPLVFLTVLQALRRRFDRHARLARVTFPIWLYVSVTGVVIYVMLYRLPVPTSPSL
jgi:protein SCO1/2/putative membrane protein